MTPEIGTHYSLLDELDARQDDLLEQIDVLNGRIESLLAQFTSTPGHPAPPPVVGDPEEFMQ